MIDVMKTVFPARLNPVTASLMRFSFTASTALVEAFAATHSRSLQQTLYAMGAAVLAARPEGLRAHTINYANTGTFTLIPRHVFAPRIIRNKHFDRSALRTNPHLPIPAQRNRANIARSDPIALHQAHHRARQLFQRIRQRHAINLG